MSTWDLSKEDELVHYLKNQLSIVLGFSELLLEELGSDDPRRKDVDEIRNAANAALRRMPELARRLLHETAR